MTIKRFRIKDFRSIVDTGWIECQQITAFVGSNESGKTSVLMALIKLMNPDAETKSGGTLKSSIGKMARIVPSADVPIDRAEELMEGLENRVFIEAEFTTDDNLNELLAKECKQKYKPVDTLYISKTYGSIYDMNIFDQFDNRSRDKVTEIVLQHLPSFMYYKEVTEITSDINFAALAYKIAGHAEKQFTLHEVLYANLLSYLNIWQSNLVRSIEQIFGDFKDKETEKKIDFNVIFREIPLFKNRFDKGFADLNVEFVKWWGHQEVTISYEVYKRGIRIIIIDNADGKQYLLQNRSTGFRRFFSLFLSFAVSAKQDFDNAVMMFDEAGAALHPLTQRKLVNFFMELGKYTQIMYNTHTSYMLPTTEMNRVRIVYKDEAGHTRISNDCKVAKNDQSEESMYAVQVSLALHLAETSLVGVLPISVVGYQDVSYLQIIKDVLLCKGMLNTTYDALIFAGGANGIDANNEIFNVGGEPPTVLLASDAEGRMIKARLLKGGYKNYANRVFEVSDFIEGAVYFEDLMPPKFVDMFVGAYLKKMLDSNFKFEPGLKLSLVGQIEEYAQRNKIELAPNFRAKVAKEMKLCVRDTFADNRLEKSYGKAWQKIMKSLLRI